MRASPAARVALGSDQPGRHVAEPDPRDLAGAVEGREWLALEPMRVCRDGEQ